jgi:hypothetical protein|tara:strand:- start:216 stop:350 length:135 start_codon:yes stop_codon:yes gene_type:complete
MSTERYGDWFETREIDDLSRYEKNFIKQNKGYYKFIESIKKLDK